MTLEDWDGSARLMSHAFLDWNMSVRELCAYFDFTYSTCEAVYKRTWEQAGRECVGTELDQYQVFEMLTTDPLPVSTQWTLRGSVIKDAVSIFEAYVEKAVNEARRKIGLPQLPDGVAWRRVVDAYDALGAEYQRRNQSTVFTAPVVVNTDVYYIRTLRHVLTHRRGIPRTEDDRRTLADITERNEVMPLRLTNDLVRKVIDTLDATVRRLDPLAWHLAGERRAWMSASKSPWTSPLFDD